MLVTVGRTKYIRAEWPKQKVPGTKAAIRQIRKQIAQCAPPTLNTRTLPFVDAMN
jgi:hypothetical protein